MLDNSHVQPEDGVVERKKEEEYRCFTKNDAFVIYGVAYPS